ncbi:MAG: VanZ family protein [Proteobacteria bacterium]|nr:VanZ family protein [Pseudomonadota bacterium]
MPLRLAHAWWGIGALMVAIDIALSLAPPGDDAALLPDKLMHFSTYFLLAFWFVSLAPRRRLVALAGVIVLGGTLEVLQGMTPLRQPESLDFLANALGALMAFVIVRRMPVNFFAWLERRLPLVRA